jgi:3-isopropylmalate/(R)-2-methylmalate dehydratase small subunit
MSEKITGKAWTFGDDVNTDLIVPGKYLELIDPYEMAKHAMEGVDPEFPNKASKGDFVIGGTNFGCGSSREHAALALRYLDLGAVIVESFARIFYRNAINVGIPALECPGITKAVKEGDTLEVDLASGVILNERTGEKLSFTPVPLFMVKVLNEGGLVPYLKKNMDEW